MPVRLQGGGEGDPTLIDEWYTPDCVWHGPGGEDVVGHDGIKAMMASLGAFPDKRYTVHDLIAEGDTVVARFTMEGTHTGDYMGIPATHRKVSMTGIYILRFEDGKTAELWVEGDFLGFMQQLGAIPG